MTGFDFRSAMRSVAQGLVVKPLLHSYLYDARFPAFDLHFPAQQMERKPDSWFHPSAHPLLAERALYYYLAEADQYPLEVKDYMGALSVTIGTAMHGFIEMCMTDAGIRPTELQRCTTCPPERDCVEFGVRDDELGERGHVDGILDLSHLRHLPADKTQPVWEYKSSKPDRLRGVEDMDLAAFKKKWPVYWAQQQRYLRLSARSYSIVLLMSTQHPWEMREFHVPFDIAFNAGIDAKYRRVRQAVADQRPPLCCGARNCPIYDLCQVVL